MSKYRQALSESARGRFLSALQRLGGGQILIDSRPPLERILLAEMLQYTGENAAASRLAQRLLSSRNTPTSLASRGHSVLGLVATARGKLRLASTAFERAVQLAEESGDAAEICRAQLNLLANVADLFGPHSTTTLTRDVSRRISSLGDTTLGIRLRLTLARAEAQRGLLEAAERHHDNVACLLLWFLAQMYARFSPQQVVHAGEEAADVLVAGIQRGSRLSLSRRPPARPRSWWGAYSAAASSTARC